MGARPFSLPSHRQLVRGLHFSRYRSGDLSDLVPPDTIPNSEVKRISGDDSSRATGRENSSSPEQYFENKIFNLQICELLRNGGFFVEFSYINFEFC